MTGFVVCPLAGVLTLALALRGMSRRERQLIVAAWGMHLAAAVGIVLYHNRVGGDMQLYAGIGRQIARFLDLGFTTYLPDVLMLIGHADNSLPVNVLLEGTSTGSMSGFAGLLLYLTDSIYGACILVSLFSFWGTLSLYRAVRDQLGEKEKTVAMAGVMLAPSVVFWSSGIVKEAFVLGFVGICIQSLSDLLLRRRPSALIGLLFGGYGVALLKPYTLFPLVLALGAGLYARRRRRRVNFGYKVLGMSLALAGILALTQLFPAFSAGQLAENVARSRQNYQLVGAMGSGVDFGEEGENPDEASIGGQLKFIPLGLVNALARPLPFDVRNVAMALAALEMSGLVGVMLWSMKRFGVRRFLGEFSSRPALFFSATFVLSLGTAIGIATANLGSLSRYRVPMMPFYVASVLVVRQRLAEAEGVRAKQRPRRPEPGRGRSQLLAARSRRARRECGVA